MTHPESLNLEAIAAENARAGDEPLPEEIESGLEAALEHNKKAAIAAAVKEAAKNIVDTARTTPEVAGSMISAYIDELATAIEKANPDLGPETAEAHARQYLAVAIESDYGNRPGASEIYAGADGLLEMIVEHPDSVKALVDDLEKKARN